MILSTADFFSCIKWLHRGFLSNLTSFTSDASTWSLQRCHPSLHQSDYFVHCIFSLLHQDCCIHIKHPGFPHQRDHWQGPGYPFARSLFSFHLCCLRPAVHLVKSGHFGNVKIIMDRYWWQIHLIGSLLNCCNYSVEKKPTKLLLNHVLLFSPNAFPPPNRVAPQSDPTKVTGDKKTQHNTTFANTHTHTTQSVRQYMYLYHMCNNTVHTHTLHKTLWS